MNTQARGLQPAENDLKRLMADVMPARLPYARTAPNRGHRLHGSPTVR
jgi:hypothetical protein